ncbi:hypothetical protein KGF54_001901 [Candida jiufengensis]|uniref:uncharacterized protein n=1 Tax=Candida jiufengensis TaxID=497108 RepID=UPI00222584D3|nr:uncharacterized protein KGF54_001901 [Candida jiufengensis]KAI5955340.1 hypothetical protein KGF54_001901 [Candida jiufengensis]
MRLNALLFTFTIFILKFVCSTIPQREYIKEFDDSIIQQTLEKSVFSLIYFYSDSCKFCQQFDPIFENLSVLYNHNSKSSSRFQILKTNARSNKKLSQLFKIQHYPSIKLLDYSTKKIESFEYNRELQTLITYIEHHVSIQPNFDNFESKLQKFNDLSTTLIKANDQLIIFTTSFLSDWKDIQYPAHFIQNLALIYPHLDITVIYSDELEDSSILQYFDVSNFPSAVYSRNGSFQTLNTNSQNYMKNNELNEAQLKKFIDTINDSENVWFDEKFMKNAKEKDNKVQQVSGLSKLQGLNNEVIDNEEDDDILEHIEL